MTETKPSLKAKTKEKAKKLLEDTSLVHVLTQHLKEERKIIPETHTHKTSKLTQPSKKLNKNM